MITWKRRQWNSDWLGALTEIRIIFLTSHSNTSPLNNIRGIAFQYIPIQVSPYSRIFIIHGPNSWLPQSGISAFNIEWLGLVVTLHFIGMAMKFEVRHFSSIRPDPNWAADNFFLHLHMSASASGPLLVRRIWPLQFGWVVDLLSRPQFLSFKLINLSYLLIIRDPHVLFVLISIWFLQSVRPNSRILIHDTSLFSPPSSSSSFVCLFN